MTCTCCTCGFNRDGDRDNPDPACHVHGEHGLRGCVKDSVAPKACDCGHCEPDPERHAEMVARGARWQETEASLEHLAPVPVRTDDTPQELAALAKAQDTKAAAAAEAQIQSMAALMTAVEAKRAEENRT